jgi:iron complex outermembrane receptor protein
VVQNPTQTQICWDRKAHCTLHQFAYKRVRLIFAYSHRQGIKPLRYFGWQLSAGQTYNESFSENKMDGLSNAFSDKFSRSYFAKAAMTFDIGKDRLLLNYDYNTYNNDTNNNSDGVYLFENPIGSSNFTLSQYNNLSTIKNKNYRNEVTATYQKKFYDKNQRRRKIFWA